MQPTNTQQPYFYSLKQIITLFNLQTTETSPVPHNHRKRHCFNGSSTMLIPKT